MSEQNPHRYERSFTIEQHRDELIERLGNAIKQIAALTAERDALSATLRQGAESDEDLRTRYTALEKERDDLRDQLDIWESNEPCPECGERHICGAQSKSGTLALSRDEWENMARTYANENADLKAQVARIRQPRVYEGATFYTQAKMPEICPDCDGRNFVSSGVKGMVCWTCCLMRDLEKAEAQVARLSAPVTDAEWNAALHKVSLQNVGWHGVATAMIASRTAPAKETKS